MDNFSRIQQLLEKYRNSQLTSAEKLELIQLAEDPAWMQTMQQLFNDAQHDAQYRQGDVEEMIHKILRENPAPKILPLSRRIWFRVAAAAIAILIIGSVAYLWKPQKENHTVATTTNPLPVKNDVKAPVVARAMITLADGRKVRLDSLARGTLALQGQVHVEKTNDGSIVYKGSSTEVQYNTLTNPRGSRVVSLQLADGSQVWLNAESSLRYPTSFAGKERTVEITGEAYFEVARDPRKKFIVHSNGIQTEVLGTHFNVHVYADEPTQTVTLLEGRVKVSKGTASLTIQPGQQATSNEKVFSKNNTADVEQVMAWRNGRFQFERTPIKDALRQFERWYNVEVVYAKEPPSTLVSGKMQRSLNLSQVLRILKGLEIQYRIEGKKLIVL